jgi:hypothetical protein
MKSSGAPSDTLRPLESMVKIKRLLELAQIPKLMISSVQLVVTFVHCPNPCHLVASSAERIHETPCGR